MNPKDFHAANTGKVIRTLKGYTAFVLAQLPPTLTYDNQLVLSLFSRRCSSDRTVWIGPTSSKAGTVGWRLGNPLGELICAGLIQ